jgi:hypothetical protein
VTVDDLVSNFAKALRSLVRAVEPLGIPWKRPDAYDEWDSLAAAAFETLVSAPLRWTVPETERVRFRLPKYDLLLESYAEHTLIEVDAGRDPERIRVFHSLESGDGKFDLVGWRAVDLTGRPLHPSFETTPRKQVTLTLRHVRADGSLYQTGDVPAPEEPAAAPASGDLDLNPRLISDIHRLARGQDDFQKFILEWIILNHFYNASWELEHGRDDAHKEWDMIEAFSRRHDVESVRKAVLDSIENLPVAKPVTKRNGDTVLSGTGQVDAKGLTAKKFWEVLYAIRNNVIHGSKSPSGEANEVNLRFASHQLTHLVSGLARKFGIDLGPDEESTTR